MQQYKNLLRLASCSVCSLGLSLGSHTAQAAPGDLDTTFGGGDGIVTTAIGIGNVQQANAMAVLADGKILLGGFSNTGTDDGAGAEYDFTLLRYNSDGTLDTSFDSDGIVATPISGSDDRAQAMAVQPDGKILLAGGNDTSTDNFALVRYNSDGSLDTSFGTGGIVTTPISISSDTANALALQPDGKILLGGFTYSYSGSLNNFALVRYNSDGSLDTSFDTDGIVITDIGSISGSNGISHAHALTVQTDGKILLGGYADNDPSGTTNRAFALVRYNSDGSLDTSFDTDGIVITEISSGQDYAHALAVQTDGKILLGGYSNAGFALVRYNSDGSLDTGFDTDGIVATSSVNQAYALTLQPDGKILLGGYDWVGASTGVMDFALVRYNSDGSLDTSFNSDGIVTAAINTDADTAYAMAIQPDGKILLGGISVNGANNDFALARILASDTAWDLTPDTFSFTDTTGVAVSSVQSSANITLAGLDTGVTVPVSVSGGEYAINAGSYTSSIGYVQNGDTISVRHTASASEGTATNTVLTVGGLHATNNTSVVRGTTTADTLTSTTVAPAAPASSGGGGSLGWPWLLMLNIPLLARRR